MKQTRWTLVLAALLTATLGWAQTDERLEELKQKEIFNYGAPDYSLLRKNSNMAKSKAFGAPEEALPDHWNNAETVYFPPVINQDRGSCGSASSIYYMFGYEMNAYRNANAQLLTNRYPTHYTWLHTNSGVDKDVIANYHGIPNVEVYGGSTYSSLFGSQDTSFPDYGWMQGYDKWFNAMNNRQLRTGSLPMSLETEEGRQIAKRWLYNHNGDQSYHSGGLLGIGVASGITQGTIKSTPANDAIGLAGKKYIACWGPKYDHALTIVGYDDRVEFDLDSNGVIGEKDKDEVGAWIIVNSWGNWASAGFIYCPYAWAGPYKPRREKSADFFTPGFKLVRQDYRPQVTLKILMDYSHRSEMCFVAGVASDTTATQPEISEIMPFFNYAGDGDKDGEDAETPMLGRWLDGMHYEPMEFGYDMTDLCSNFDRTQPLKFFFTVNLKKNAKGSGHIYKMSLINYETDPAGTEVPFRIDTVAIKGKSVTLGVVAMGEQVYKPLNVVFDGKNLTWQAPQTSSLPLKGYYIYENNILLDSTDAQTLSYTLPVESNSSFSVAAAYQSCTYVSVSQKVEAQGSKQEGLSEKNLVCEVKNSSFVIPDVFTEPMNEATIEFWLKPYTCTNYNQQVGSGWGRFLMHTTSGRAIYYGWNTSSGNRSAQGTALLTTNKWQHIAVTISGKIMSLYINGARKNTFTASSYSGMPSLGSLIFGVGTSYMNGQIDEVRLWKTCRTAADILRNKDMEIVNPGAQADLLAYFKMDEIMDNGMRKLRDCAHGHHAQLLDETKVENKEDQTIMQGYRAVEATFAITGDDHKVGKPVQVEPVSYVNTVSWVWKAPDAGVDSLNAYAPSFVFTKEGTYPITLVMTDTKGVRSEVTKEVTVSGLSSPVADFEIGEATLPAGDHFSFINRSQGENCTFVWTIPDADQKEVKSTNAIALFEKVGDHQVTLTATNAAGSSSVTKTVTVTKAAPAPAFSVWPSGVLKGEKVFLRDATRYEPTTWYWEIEGASTRAAVVGQNSSYTTVSPGYYDVTLTSSNDQGQNSVTLNKVFAVVNAESGNGLNFSGPGQLLSVEGALSNATKVFTVDWWMNPSTLQGAVAMTESKSGLHLVSDAAGALIVNLDGKSASSGINYIIRGEWHHYAVTYSSGRFSFYRDAVRITQSSAIFGVDERDFSGIFTVGDNDNGTNAQIDEFRLWNSALIATGLKDYANEPIADVAAAEASDKLAVYYNFNQDHGNPTDLTSNGHDGVRSGFGPDGDAWSSSFGVFTLNFESGVKSQNVSSLYMKGYNRPFRNTGVSVNKRQTAYMQLETGTERSPWIMENAIVTDTIVTGAYVRTTKSGDLCVDGGSFGFALPLENHKVYQTVTLPVGLYRFSVELDGNMSGNGNRHYLMASRGTTLNDVADLAKALGYVNFTEGNSFEFFVPEETVVSLGANFNQSAAGITCIKSFKLERILIDVTEADGQTGVKRVNASTTGQTAVVPVKGGVNVSTSAPTEVRVYSVDGSLVRAAVIKGTRFIALPAGIYIVDGVKVAVTK